MNSYQNTIEKIIATTSIKREEVFEYEETPFEESCTQYYNFFQKYLKEYFTEYSISDTLFFFNNDRRVNGWALTENNQSVISFNIGTIKEFEEIFYGNLDIFKELEINDYVEFERNVRRPIMDMMFQNTILFLFYHETAHIIQRSEMLKDRIHENPTNSTDFNIQNHLLEIDADTFASIRMGRHIIAYLKKLDKEHQTSEYLQKAVITSCVGIGIFRLYFMEYAGEIYYEEKTHPHLIIRLFSIMNTIINYTNIEIQSDTQLEIDKLDVTQAIDDSIKLLQTIYSKIYDSDLLGDLEIRMRGEGSKISAYHSKLTDLISKDEKMACNKRNSLSN